MRKTRIIGSMLVFAGLVVLMSGCTVNYRIAEDVDLEELRALNQQKTVYDQTLYYKIEKPDMLTNGGPEKIDEMLASQSCFKSVEKIQNYAIPEKGCYLRVSPEWRLPSMAAMGFGYLSFATSTILPAWSTKDGYDLYFTFYRDGSKVKTFDYKIERTAAMWLGLLPFVWVNFLTNSETDAFEVATYQFFSDLEAYLAAADMLGAVAE